MDKIQVRILYHNFNNMPLFLAKLTQRGHLIHSMNDLNVLYCDTMCNDTPMSKEFMQLPHTTLRRMCYMTVAVVGLSTKAVSQLRTHAKHLTFLSTSTQYSAYNDKKNNYVIPEDDINLKIFLEQAQKNYEALLNIGFDKDTASYLLPQALRKVLVISGSLADWEYVLSTRLCNRNTKEVQHICELIVQKVKEICGEEFTYNMYPSCVTDKCHEGKMSCGHKYIICTRRV